MNTPNTINGRTPEEIKKGLECCNTFNVCHKCPYEKAVDTEHGWGCVVIRNADALAYIHQLERERDAAVLDLEMCCPCEVCTRSCKYDKVNAYDECADFEWRGVEVER